jgi:hypothetical protein
LTRLPSATPQALRRLISEMYAQGCIVLWFGPRAVPARSSHDGEKVPEGPTPKRISTRCEPGRLAVRGLWGHPVVKFSSPHFRRRLDGSGTASHHTLIGW